jgi:hypothetical protein
MVGNFQPGRLRKREIVSMIRKILASFGLCALLAPLAAAQITGDQISYYFGDWHNATPRTIRGSLVERDILTRGPPLRKLLYLRDTGAERIDHTHAP